MRYLNTFLLAAGALAAATSPHEEQAPLLHHATSVRPVSAGLFAELEELARIVDITYCVGLTSFGITKPFNCLSRCSDFPDFQLVTTWNTGPLLSDSCGYIALDRGKKRIIVAFRGTYSIANTIVDLSTVPQEYAPYPGGGDDDEIAPEDRIMDKQAGSLDGVGSAAAECENCTVHSGFQRAWLATRSEILWQLRAQLLLHPEYKIHFVGHSLGGAVAALGALDYKAHGYDPIVTTFGEPRIGNEGLARYLDERFNLTMDVDDDDTTLNYRRVTHISDPVPLLPLTEWSYVPHAGEIYISKSDLSPDIPDVQCCSGDADPDCIAGQDSTLTPETADADSRSKKQDLLASVKNEVHDVKAEPWGIPARYKLWQLFFAHRDYFWRLGVCVPGGDPLGGGGKYAEQYKAEL